MQFNSSTKSTKINIGNLKKSNYISLNSNNIDSVYEEIDYSNVEESNNMSAVDMVRKAKYSKELLEYKGMLEERKQQLEEQLENLEYVYDKENDSVFVNNYYYSTMSETKKDELQGIGPYPQTFDNFVESNKDLKTRIDELRKDYDTICTLLSNVEYEIQLSPYTSLRETEQYQNYINNYNYQKVNIDYEKLKEMDYDVISYLLDAEFFSDVDCSSIDRLAVLEYILANNNESVEDIVYPHLTNMNVIDQNLNDLVICYKYMTEEEKMMYHYLFDTEGEESANEYLLILQDKINQSYGVDLANEFLSDLDVDDEGKIKENLANIFGVSVQGLDDGISNFYSGIENALINNEQLTAEEYKKMVILQTLTEQTDNLDFVYNFNTSLGNMVPAMTTSAIVSFLGSPVAGTKVASILMGTSAYGNAKHQALTEGNSTLSSTIYGLLIGTSEATLGYFLGKIPGISQTTGFTLKSLLCEGVEEYSQTWIDAGLQAIVLGNDVDWSSIPEEATDSFIMGMLMSGFTNGGQAIINLTINGTQYKIDIEKTIAYMKENPNTSATKAVETVNASINQDNGNKQSFLGLFKRKVINIDFLNDFFSKYNNGTNYGVDQGFLRQLFYTVKLSNGMSTNKPTPEYTRLKDKLISQGFSTRSANIIMHGLDSVGACSYADIANGIFASFRDKPQRFFDIFGYSMFTTDINGNTILNSGELLLDLYTFFNNTENGGSLFQYNDYTGKIEVISLNGQDMTLNAKNQKYLSYTQSGHDIYSLKQFFSSKGLKLNDIGLSPSMIDFVLDVPTAKNLKKIIEQALKSGKNVSLSMGNEGSEIYMHAIDPGVSTVTTNTWNEGEGHAMFVTSITEDGVVVSSWGKRYLITFSDLVNSGDYTFNSWTIEER